MTGLTPRHFKIYFNMFYRHSTIQLLLHSAGVPPHTEQVPQMLLKCNIYGHIKWLQFTKSSQNKYVPNIFFFQLCQEVFTLVCCNNIKNAQPYKLFLDLAPLSDFMCGYFNNVLQQHHPSWTSDSLSES